MQLPQKIMHSVGLSKIDDKLIPSIDWKKSFNRSSTQVWGPSDRLSQAVKIRTSRLYFSRWRAPSAMVLVGGDTVGGPETGSMMWLSWPVLPAAPRSHVGEPTLAGSSFAAMDLPGIFGLCLKVRW